MSRRTGGGFRRRIRDVISILALTGIGVALIGYGGYTLWVGHSGTPAQVTLLECRSPGHSKSSDCSAEWIRADGTKRIVTVNDIPNDEAVTWPRKTLDVRVDGDQAFMNSSSSGAVYMILFGIALFGLGLFVLLPTRANGGGGSVASRMEGRFRRRSQEARPDDPGIPPAQIT
jgi:hypothetical protein